jgi:hypothetical protein
MYRPENELSMIIPATCADTPVSQYVKSTPELMTRHIQREIIQIVVVEKILVLRRERIDKAEGKIFRAGEIGKNKGNEREFVEIVL